MTNRTLSMVALAAALALGLAAIAADQPGQDPGAGAGAQPGQMGGDQMTGQQIDRQILQQLQEFAKDPKTAGDRLFILSAAQSCRFEYELSQQAQQKAKDPQVKQLAQRLVQGHEKLGQQLQQTAQKLGVQLPNGLGEFRRQEIQIFTALPEDQFDKRYVATMQATHVHDVTAYQTASQIAQNPDLKQFANQNATALQGHWQEVNRCATALGLPSGMEAVPAGGRMAPAGGGGGGGGGGGDMNR